jgi:hypothetical protein
LPNKKTAEKTTEDETGSFSFRIKNGDQEVEITGTHEEVTKMIENLPKLVPNIQKAFDSIKPKTVATLTVKTEPQQKSASEEHTQQYPKINAPANSEDAVLRVLGTDWGKWRPRTTEELKEAMKANGVKYSDRVLSESLETLARKGMLRRWNTNNGFVYILADEKKLRPREEPQ